MLAVAAAVIVSAMFDARIVPVVNAELLVIARLVVDVVDVILIPVAQAPEIDIPVVQTLDTEIPVVLVLATEIPVVSAPVILIPVVPAPDINMPVVNAPANVIGVVLELIPFPNTISLKVIASSSNMK
uniref:Uncharacterized protein n=1 Tax=viral metagenome TaxID=1070528 RepID=A0A6M3IQR6_9ZZZZ